MRIKEIYPSGINGRIKAPKIRGHVKIRLYNPNTWKQEIIEGDNMMTNALDDIFENNLCGALNYNNFLPIYSKLVGGILCFENQLDISSAGAADDYFIPDNGANTVVAHAGQTALTSQADDIKRGDPLDTGMTVADGEVTLAWEWGSTAGVGTIRSVALTHSDVGDAGTGAASDAFMAMTPNINGPEDTASKDVWFIDANGYGYNFEKSGTSVTLTRFPMPYKKAGLVAQNYNYLTGVQSSRTITMQTSFGNFPSFYFDKATNILHLWYNTSLSTTVQYDTINLSDWDHITTTHASWTLQTAVGSLAHDRGPITIPVYNGYVYLPIMNGNNISKYLKVNISSTGDEAEISASEKNSGVFIPNTSGRVLVGKDFVINNNTFYKTALASPDELNAFNNYNHWTHSTLDSGVGLTQMTYKRRGILTHTFYTSTSKFYLASKFNLPTAVSKSNTQNMVVTYTLTEVST